MNCVWFQTPHKAAVRGANLQCAVAAHASKV